MKHQTIYKKQRLLNVNNKGDRQTVFISTNLESHKKKE